MTQERRRRCRVQLEIPLTIETEGVRIRGKVHDLSLKGLSCTAEEWLVPGHDCRVTLELESGLRLHMDGRILRAGREENAIDFIRMDEDSFRHLRNLVRLYAEDADMVDEELGVPAFSSEEEPSQE